MLSSDTVILVVTVGVNRQTMFCHVFVAVLFSNLWILRARCEHWPVNVFPVPSKLASCACPAPLQSQVFLVGNTTFLLNPIPAWEWWLAWSLWIFMMVMSCWFLVIVKEEIWDYSGTGLGLNNDCKSGPAKEQPHPPHSLVPLSSVRFHH